MNAARNSAVAPFHLRFWGVRGSIPTPSPNQLGIGGNTPCLQVFGNSDASNPSEEILIFDAGTGIRALGREIVARALTSRVIHIFLTHFHWDHVQGLPYFLPLFSPDANLIFHSAHPPERLRAVLAAQMKSPYFPVLFDQLPGALEFRAISAEPERFGSVTVETFPLNHPQGSVGYRIAHPRKTVIYATDHEHGDTATHDGLIAVAQDADVLVYDAQYTPAEYKTRQGWGHSTWLEGARVANQAGVRRLVLFHHDPERSDRAVRHIEDEAREEFPATCAGYEGLLL